MTDECYGIIDEDGNPIIPADYCLITDCSDGKFIGVNKNTVHITGTTILIR